MTKLHVFAHWDAEASLWVATSDDIPGLVTEASSLDELLERVLAVAPELLEDNAHFIEYAGEPGDTIDLSIQSPFRLDGARAH